MLAADVLAMRSYYSRIGVWPDQPFEIDPEGWLGNFAEGRDSEIAVALLDSFMFIGEDQTLKMFESAFASLSSEPYVAGLPEYRFEDKWSSFRKSVLVSFPTDDEDSASGSGYMFVRLARQKLVLQDAQLFDPGQLVEHLAMRSTPTPIVFVDDIVGSGDQFTQTWRREIAVAAGTTTLSAEVRRLQCPIFYTPAVCTETGWDAISGDAPEVVIRPAHFLPHLYGAQAPDTILVPETMREELPDFLRRYSAIARVPQHATFGWRGLGLALAFEHSTPDFTLPLFFSEKAGWRPLRKRR